jgi:hypothetical protein
MRSVTGVLVLLCALGSVAFTLYAGQHNRSIVLVVMFALWVGLPFVGIVGVLRRGDRGSRRTTRTTALILSFASLAIYAMFALHPLGHRAAAPFLVVPLASWIVLGVLHLRARGDRG